MSGVSSPAALALPPPPEPGATSRIGERIGRYVITRELARGGMGVVYEAAHESIGHRAAVKVLSTGLSKDKGSGDYAGRFFDEARAVNVVQHPGIVKIFDFGVLRDETVYIMMEYLEGESLWDRHVRVVHRQGGRVPMGDVLRLGRLIASALAAAHEKRIIHRDLKPENVIIVPDPDVPGGERTKVLDFGIARFMDSAQRRTVAGMVMGTAMYMAPEQCRGADHLDGKVDVYALGCILYEMLSGRPPFEGDPNKVMVMQVTQAPRPLWEQVPGLPEPVHRLVHAMLAKKPAERPTMAEVVARILPLEGALPSKGAASSEGATVSLPRFPQGAESPAGSTQMLGATSGAAWPRRRLPLLVALGLVTLLLAGLALWRGTRRPQGTDPGPAQPADSAPAATEPGPAPERGARPGQVAPAEGEQDDSPAPHRRRKKHRGRRP